MLSKEEITKLSQGTFIADPGNKVLGQFQVNDHSYLLKVEAGFSAPIYFPVFTKEVNGSGTNYLDWKWEVGDVCEPYLGTYLRDGEINIFYPEIAEQLRAL